MLKELLSDIIKIDDILIIVRNDGAIIEMRSNSLNIHQKEKWITIGDNDGPGLDLQSDKRNTVRDQAIWSWHPI